MAKETVSIAISNGDSTNPIQASVIPTIADPTKNALVIAGADGGGVPVTPFIDTSTYAITDLDESGTTKYYGFTDKTGGWYILQITSTTARYIKGASTYTTNRTNRASLVYDYYYTIF